MTFLLLFVRAALAHYIAARFERAAVEALCLYGGPAPGPGTAAYEARDLADRLFTEADRLRTEHPWPVN